MKFNIPLTFFIFPVAIHAATITFFGVKETASTPGPPYPTGSITYRPIGVGADGATTYAEEYVWSEYLQWSRSKYTSGGSIQTADSPTTTVTVPPQTFRGTLVADATHYIHNYALHGYPHVEGQPEQNGVQECELDGKGGMECVGTVYMAGRPIATTSIKGEAVPVHTLVTVEDQAGSGKNGAMRMRGAGLFGAGVVMCLGVALGFNTL